MLPTGTPKTKFPPSHPCHEISCGKKRDGWDYAKLFAELIGLVFLIAYTIFTAKIYCANQKATDAAQRTLGEIQKQTTMVHQQLVGTIGAVVTFQQPRITDDPLTSEDILVIQLVNQQGRVTAPEAHVAFEIDTVSFPKLTPIFNSQRYTMIMPQFGASGWSRNYPLRYFSPRGQQASAQKKTLIVKGTFGFDNGFGDKIADQEFCFSYIGSFNLKHDGGFMVGYGNFLTCDEFRERASYILKHRVN